LAFHSYYLYWVPTHWESRELRRSGKHLGILLVVREKLRLPNKNSKKKKRTKNESTLCINENPDGKNLV